MNSGPTSSRWSHPRTFSATNSGPLSERMWAGKPRVMNSCISRSSTSSLFSFRATAIARHSRLYSSMIVSRRKARPSRVRSIMKS